jgi:hypothetical protein
MWYRKGAQIQNQKGKVFDVQGGVDAEDRYILAWKRHGKVNQQFDIIYADEWKRDPIKGELSPDYGLYVDRTFYVVSHMSGRRYLDVVNNRNMVIKTRNARKTQLWWFDQRSRTIKTRYNNQSWDIKSSGRTNEMQIWSTNSGWF